MAVESVKAWAVTVNGRIDVRTIKPTKAEAQSEWLGTEKELHVNHRHAAQLEGVWNALRDVGTTFVVPVRVEVES